MRVSMPVSVPAVVSMSPDSAVAAVALFAVSSAPGPASVSALAAVAGSSASGFGAGRCRVVPVLLLMMVLGLGLLLMGTGTAQAATILYSSNFSAASGANSVAGWTYVGGDGGGLSRNATAWDNFDLGGGVFGGDGVKGDGALLLNTGDSIAGNESWTYNVVSTMSEGELLNLVGAAFNANSSHNSNFTIGLYNVTDGRVLVTSAAMGNSRVGASDADNTNPFFNFNLSYTTTAEDAGDVLQIRVLENLNNTARDPYFDYITLTSAAAAVPEPSRMLLMAVGGMVAGLRRRRAIS